MGDGLADNDVYCMLQDRSGAVWFGTASGVSRYDGVSWRTFTTADGLADNLVSSILEDRSGALWFAGSISRGVSRYDGASWHIFTAADGLVTNYVTSMLEDRNGALWFGGFGGVSRYDGVSWRTFTTLDGLASNFVRSMLEDRSGAIWVGTNGGGVSRYNGSGWHTFATFDGLPDNTVFSMLEERDGTLLFATNAGLSFYDGVTWRAIPSLGGIAINSDNILSILQDRSGALWLGTAGGGVIRSDGGGARTFTTADGLANDFVTSMLQDQSGALWFGTSGAGVRVSWFGTGGAGVSRYDGVSWRTLTTTDSLADNTVLSMLKDGNGALWFGTNGGVSRYNGSWRTFTTTDSLANNTVLSILEDHNGAMWFGTDGGVSRYDGRWRTFTTADSLAGDTVLSLLQDRNGALWFGTNGGVSRYDGNWHTFTTADSLAGNSVLSMLEDRDGALWFGTTSGVSRYNGGWRTFSIADSLASDSVSSMLEDRSGAIWFGTAGGVSRYNGMGWRTFRPADGLASNLVLSMLEDRSGALWFGTVNGVSRYDGVIWLTLSTADGLPDRIVLSMLEDLSGTLWFGTESGGVTAHNPDRVAPRTVFLSGPSSVSANRLPSIGYLSAFDDQRILFQHALARDSTNYEPWSDWSPSNVWTAISALNDGGYDFRVRARDTYDNVESPPESLHFDIDGTPPSPAVRYPGADAVLRDSITVRGTAADARFAFYRLEYRLRGAGAWTALGDTARTPVTDGVLGGWNTRGPVDGKYELRLSVADKLGLVGSVIVPVSVDNHFPYTAQTSPALVTAAAGGDVYTDDGAAHLYLPPQGLSRDTIVTVTALDTTEVPASLPDGAVRVSAGYEVNWGTVTLAKAATLDLARPAGDAIVVYAEGVGLVWGLVGGTSDVSTGRITVPVSAPGRYALFREGSAPSISGEARLSAITLTPRVFSPRGTYAATSLAIGFALGRPGAVTVKVYNRAGRLVREVATGLSLGAGANVVRWDGRDREGREVEEGAYLVTIGAFGETQTRALAVVR